LKNVAARRAQRHDAISDLHDVGKTDFIETAGKPESGRRYWHFGVNLRTGAGFRIE